MLAHGCTFACTYTNTQHQHMTRTLTPDPGEDCTGEEGLTGAVLGVHEQILTMKTPTVTLDPPQLRNPWPWWSCEQGPLSSFLAVEDGILGHRLSLVNELGSMNIPLHRGKQDSVVKSRSTLWSMKGRKRGREEGGPGTDEGRGCLSGHLTFSSIPDPRYQTMHAVLETFKHYRKLRSVGNKSPKALIQSQQLLLF